MVKKSKEIKSAGVMGSNTMDLYSTGTGVKKIHTCITCTCNAHHTLISVNNAEASSFVVRPLKF